jgi:Tol biopolymer transport system component
LLKNQQAMRWSPDGTFLATIVAGSTRGDTLIIGNADGSNQREVIPPRGGRHIHWPAWSPDSRFIYFIYTFDTWHTEPSEIYRVSVAGGEPEAVVQSVRRAVYPVPTAGGLIYAANPNSTNLGLWWHPDSGGNAQPLTTDVGEYTECRLSADGRHLVCTLVDMKQSLVRVAVGKVPSAQSLTDGYSSDLDPDFSPQGDRIVFSTLRAGSRNLWTMAPDGTQTAPLTSGPSIDERPAYSPDGQQIAFVSDRGGRRGIWVVNAGGGAPRLVGQAVVLDTLSWSADGSRILFATPHGDLPQPATMSLADGKTTVMATAEGGFAPRLSRNGNRIAYFKPVQGRPALAFMDGQGAALYPQLVAGANFGNPFLAWATDGRRVAAVSMSANANAQIWIVDPDAAVPFQKLLEQPAGIRMRGITWTPDGSSVIFAQQDPHSDIVVFDLERP